VSYTDRPDEIGVLDLGAFWNNAIKKSQMELEASHRLICAITQSRDRRSSVESGGRSLRMSYLVSFSLQVSTGSR
jgi:hypothetical protein